MIISMSEKMDSKKSLNIIEENKCTCEDQNPHDDDRYHTCPHAEELANDYESECSCCEYCTEQCAQDI